MFKVLPKSVFFRASRYHHEQELDESFPILVQSLNLDEFERGSRVFKVYVFCYLFLTKEVHPPGNKVWAPGPRGNVVLLMISVKTCHPTG